INFNVAVSNAQAGDKLLVTVEDTNFRTVYTAEQSAKNADFSIQLKTPYTLLYRVFAKVLRNGNVIGRSMSEFAVTGKQLDHTDFHAGMWGGRLILGDMLRQLGFDLISADGRRNNTEEGTLRNITNLNCYPLILNMGHVGLDHSRGHVYRGDKPSDPVRNPCFSNPAVTDSSKKAFEKLAKQNKFNYYSGMYHMLGDEMFLGSSVCYSDYCLKEFREYLKKDYKNIANLNKVWGSKFASFDDVIPVQRNAVENSSNLAPWLDHKMFMINVWSHSYIGKRVEFIQNGVPGAKIGMSGTQVPGYGYDWAQLMKHLACTAYYNGVQTTLVNQWQQAGSLSGQWGGGYVSPGKLYDVYQRSFHWSNLIKGANMAWNWHGSAYNGDGSPTINLKSYCEEFNIIKKGIAKLLLTADKDNAEVAVLYSQPSVFTAMAGGIGIAEWQNTQTGWEALLLDLKFTTRYITYENLADSKFDLNRF
ncbi:MAG: beta-galactosidase, partial [Lentisphaeria bacterium]|nr:beta-galactosidase [Lentisphaeria bacterium]